MMTRSVLIIHHYYGYFFFFFLWLWLLLSFLGTTDGAILGKHSQKNGKPSQRSFQFRNQSGRRVDVLWVNVFQTPNEYVSQNNGEGYPYGGDTNILSFIGHEFEIREMPSKKTQQCVFEKCRTVRFQVNDQENQIVIIDKNFQVIHKDDRQRAYAIADGHFKECQQEVQQHQQEQQEEEEKETNMDSSVLLQSIESITACMERKVQETIIQNEEEREFQASVRQAISNDLVSYACGDVNFTESVEVSNVTWTYRPPAAMAGRGGKNKEEEYTLNVFHQRPTSQIFKIDNFTSTEFCNAIRIYQEKEQTNNDDDDGGNKIVVPFTAMSEPTVQGSLLFQLGTKLYSLARDQLGWETLEFAHMHKQGLPLFEAMVDPVGLNVPPLVCIGDEEKAYEQASMGLCRMPGAPPLSVPTYKIVVPANQIAQFFLFCDQPANELLGGVHFAQASIHIKPQVGRLVVAIHQQPNFLEEMESTSILDGFVSEYHLCPNYNTYSHTLQVPVEV